MIQITLVTGVSYPNPVITANGDGELGDKTLTFTTGTKTVSVWRDNVIVIKLRDAGAPIRPTHERIVLTSGAVYENVTVGGAEAPDVFGDEQLVFAGAAGVFITRRNHVIGLIPIRTRPTVTAQKL